MAKMPEMAKPPAEVVVDSDAFNILALDDAALARVVAAVDAGRLKLRCSHLTAEEVARTPDPLKRRALQRLPVSLIVVGVLPVDFVRWDMAAFPSEAAEAIYNDVQIGNLDHVEDAALVATAYENGLTVVCVDRRLTNACRRHGVPVMHPSELLARLAP
jgi:rRNA-processing protein FCF1